MVPRGLQPFRPIREQLGICPWLLPLHVAASSSRLCPVHPLHTGCQGSKLSLISHPPSAPVARGPSGLRDVFTHSAWSPRGTPTRVSLDPFAGSAGPFQPICPPFLMEGPWAAPPPVDTRPSSEVYVALPTCLRPPPSILFCEALPHSSHPRCPRGNHTTPCPFPDANTGIKALVRRLGSGIVVLNHSPPPHT